MHSSFGNKMITLRWLIALPIAVIASFATLSFEGWIIDSILPPLSGKFFSTPIGFIVSGAALASASGIYILTGVLVSPSRGRRVCFAFYFLSHLLSGPGFHLLIF